LYLIDGLSSRLKSQEKRLHKERKAVSKLKLAKKFTEVKVKVKVEKVAIPFIQGEIIDLTGESDTDEE
jgi:hypothetical protein